MATRTHFSHWGAFEAEVEQGRLVGVRPHQEDPDPSPLIDNFLGSIDHAARVRRPAFREGWLERGPGSDRTRGRDRYVELPWPEAIERLSAELKRVYGTYGGRAVFGGSYGWSSAGRFHHAQSQLHRFLNCLGGYVRSVGTYSVGAAEALFPHILGMQALDYSRRYATSWESMIEHTQLMVAFGGLPLKNAMVRSGGVLRHRNRDHLQAMKARGARFVSFSPLRDDMPGGVDAEWIRLRPGSDTAVMLALAYVLAREKRHDLAFLQRYCAGGERFEPYLLGTSDGQAKTPEWAERLSG